MSRTSSKAPAPSKTGRISRTPLHVAAIDANAREVVRLLAEGSDVNSQDEQGWTPLHFAAQSQSNEIVKQLLAAGADLSRTDGHGNTALFRAVFSYVGDGTTIKLLQAAGADPKAKNNHGVSPAELARTIANKDVSKYFAGGQDAE
jgi:uncharacterized protein